MKRKVIQIAGSTQLVSLPREWCKSNNIKKGQEVEVLEAGNQIIITTDTYPKKNFIKVDISGIMPKLADRFLARAYQQGYDELTIQFSSIETSVALQNKVRELLGFDIFEQDEHRMVIKSLSSKLDVDFDAALRKAFLIMVDVSQTCLNAFKKNDKITLENLHYRDLEINKFCYFCLRAINKQQYDNNDRYILYYIIETLEDTGDAYKELLKLLVKLSPKEKLVGILDKVNDILRMSYDFFYKPESDKAYAAYNKILETRKSIDAAIKNSTPDEIRTIMVLDTILRLIYHFSTMRLDKLKEFKEVNTT